MYQINNKPTVVIDLSWLQSRSLSTLNLTDDYEYIVPDALAIEILDKKNKTRVVDKFIKLIELNHKNISFSNTIGHVVQNEIKSDKPIGQQHLLQIEFNNGLRTGQYEPLELKANMFNCQGWKAEYKSKVKLWKEHLESHAVNFRAQHIEHKKSFDKAANSLSEETKLVQQHWVPWIAIASSVDFSPIWKQRLTSFPDTWQLGLYGRLIFYCMVQQLFDRTTELENNFDDIEYAFLAIKTGKIATRDKGLSRMIEMCSGVKPVVFKNDVPAITVTAQ